MFHILPLAARILTFRRPCCGDARCPRRRSCRLPGPSSCQWRTGDLRARERRGVSLLHTFLWLPLGSGSGGYAASASSSYHWIWRMVGCRWRREGRRKYPLSVPSSPLLGQGWGGSGGHNPPAPAFRAVRSSVHDIPQAPCPVRTAGSDRRPWGGREWRPLCRRRGGVHHAPLAQRRQPRRVHVRVCRVLGG